MKNWGGHFTPELGGHFELESGGHFKLELGGQYHWNLQQEKKAELTLKELPMILRFKEHARMVLNLEELVKPVRFYEQQCAPYF